MIQVRHFGPDNTTPSSYNFNTSTFTTWVSVSFTPKSTSSKILVEADGNYSIGGGGLDFFEIRVLDAGNSKFVKDQIWGSAVGTGTRSSVLLPLKCGYTNSSTSARNIEIQIRQGSSDDTLGFPDGNNNWTVVVSEIAT